MATTKKPAAKSTKKTSVKPTKASTAKKTAPAKASAKKAPSRPASKTSVRRVRSQKASTRSFKPVKETQPFFSFRVTDQTVYWLILSLVVLALGMWVVSINDKVQRIYDEIDRVNAAEQSMVLPTKAAE